MTVENVAEILDQPRRIRDKIVTVDQLANIVRALKSSGKTVVQCHGTFDLLHPGHLRHLEAAHHEGDILIVTVTADEFVNKGPGRPIYNQQLRCEMLASLQFVSWVAVNSQLDAVSLIHKIQPNIYAKGQDYADAGKDVTGKIRLEVEAVESHGGKFVMTNEITFSSTQLTNQHFDIYKPEMNEYLRQLRKNKSMTEIFELVESVRDYRVVFIGDTIIDEYRYVAVMGKSAKENIIATRHLNSDVFAGGVIAAANQTAAFCKEVEIITVLGNDNAAELDIQHALKPNVKLSPVYRNDSRTIRKIRFVEKEQTRKLFEVCHISDAPINQEVESDLLSLIYTKLADADMVIVTDFGHGLLTPVVIKTLANQKKFLAVNAQANSANRGFNLITKYPRADYICINSDEARLAVSDRHSPLELVVGRELASRIDCPKMIVTQGRRGSIAYSRGHEPMVLPAFADKVVDSMGAGDAVLAVTAPLVAAGGDMEAVGFIGNILGALNVKMVGQQSVEKASVIKGISALLK